MEGFGLQHNPKYDLNAGNSLGLQTDWGFPNSLTNGRIYQCTAVPAGNYRLTGTVAEYAPKVRETEERGRLVWLLMTHRLR